MAQTNQELSLRLTVESAGFKEKMLEARKALYALEGAGVKAAGGQKKYAAAVKLARMELKKANGVYKEATTSLQLQAIAANKTANATVKLGKSQKRSNMAMTQAAYAIDDMQYGFQGVQNNIQAMAVSMGASGALVIGLTAVTVAVGLLVKKFKAQNKAANEAKKVLKDADGLIASMMLYASVAQDAEASTETQKESLQKLVDNGYDPLIDSIDDYIEKLREQSRIEADVAKHQSKVQDLLAAERDAQDDLDDAQDPSNFQSSFDQILATFEKGSEGAEKGAQERLDKRIAGKKEVLRLARLETKEYLDNNKIDTTGGTNKKSGGDDDDAEELGVGYSHDFLKGFKSNIVGSEIFSNMKQGIKDMLELQKAEGADKEELLRSELAQLQAIDLKVLSLENQAQVLHDIKVLQAEIANIPGIADNMVGVDKATIAMEKFKDQLADIKLMLDEGVISWDEYVRRIDNATESYNNVSKAQQNTVDVGGMLTSQLTSLISGFAEAAGGGDDMGNALLKGLGNMLVQLGGLIIAAGVAALNLVITLSNPAMAPLAIAAGAALVAAGAAVSSFANKAGGGGGGSSAGRASSSSSSTVINNPVRENARVRNSNLIIPMDMMRYGMQNAEDNYSGFN